MIQNMRDLGGMRTADGHVIRKGMLIRSAQLARAEEEDLRGVSAVIDLRTPGERREAPDRTYGQTSLELPVFDDIQAGISHESGAEDGGIPDLALLYGRLMRECTASFRRILTAIMRHDFTTGAILWHCTEGKDRCGMTTALVLEVLGVDRALILEDYLLTNLVNLPKAEAVRERYAPAYGEAFANRMYQAYIADERYLRAAWDAMGETYIRDVLQIADAEAEAFRQTVLDKA